MSMMLIQILGVEGHHETEALKANVSKAVADLGLKATIEEISKVSKLTTYAISDIPAMLVDGHITFQKNIPSVKELKQTLEVLAGSPIKVPAMKKILVPIDFSENAKNALAYAIDLAKHWQAELTLLHTYDLQVSTGLYLSSHNFLLEDIRHEMSKTLDWVRQQSQGKVKLDYQIVQGETATVIQKIAKRQKTDLVVMGTQGATGLVGAFLGSTTNEVLKKADIPVLAVPSHCRLRTFETIAFAMDERMIASVSIVHPLIFLAQTYQSKVAVYHLSDSEISDEVSEEITRFLKGSSVSFTIELGQSNLHQKINTFTKNKNADLLCMVRRKKGILERAFHSSSTTKQVFRSPVPLLVLMEQ